MNLVYRRNSISDTRHDLRCQLETQIHAFRADVEKHVAWRRNRMACSRANFAEHAQFRWQRQSKEPLPCAGPEAHDTGKARFKIAKFHCAYQPSEVSAERPYNRAIAGARFECHDQEDRGASERRCYWLGDDSRAVRRFGTAHRIGFYVECHPSRARSFEGASGVRTDSRGYFFGRRRPAELMRRIITVWVATLTGWGFSEASPRPRSALIS